MSRVMVLFLTLAAGCSFGPGNLQSKQASDLEARKIRRIAVMPPETSPTGRTAKIPFTSPTPPGSSVPDRNASELLAHLVHSVLASMANWQIVSESEIREVEQSVPRANELARTQKVGALVYADAVIITRIQRYRERVGDEWGAKSPASVAFVLDLVDVNRGDVVWTARFDETQKSLSENIFALGDVGQRGLRWLSASQLTHEGVKKAVGQLHQILVRSPTS